MDRPSHDCIVVFIIHVRVHVCVLHAFCFLCVGARVWVDVGACVHACVRAYMRTYEWWHVFLITCALLYRLVLIT